MARRGAQYVTNKQLLARLARCEHCGHEFRDGEKCFEEMGLESWSRHCPAPGCFGITIFHALRTDIHEELASWEEYQKKQEEKKEPESVTLFGRERPITELLKKLGAQMEGLSEQEFDQVIRAGAAWLDNYFKRGGETK